MMAKGLIRGVTLLSLLGLLAGCAEAELAVHNAKRLQEPSAPVVRTGEYKVGRPYQIAQVWYYPREDYSYDETGIASWYGPGFHGKTTANGETYDQNAMTAAHRTLPMPSLVQVTNLENGRSVQVRVNDRGPFAHGRIIDMSAQAAKLLGFKRKGVAKVRVQVLEVESQELARAAGAEINSNAPPAVPVESVAVQELAPLGAAPAEPALAPVEVKSVASQPAAKAVPARLRTATLMTPEPVVTQQRVRRTQIYVQAGAFIQVGNAVQMRARLSPLGNVQIAKALVGEDNFYRVRLGPMASVAKADETLELLLNNGINDARVVVD